MYDCCYIRLLLRRFRCRFRGLCSSSGELSLAAAAAEAGRATPVASGGSGTVGEETFLPERVAELLALYKQRLKSGVTSYHKDIVTFCRVYEFFWIY